MVSDALRKCRDAIADPSDAGSYPSQAVKPDFPTWDNNPVTELVNRLGHWDAWTIPYIALTTLLKPLDVVIAAQRASATLTIGGVNAVTLRRPSLAQFKNELPHAIADAELRDDRASEIFLQAEDTRPFWQMILPLTPDKTPATWLLLAIAQQLALHVEMRFKHGLACARPVEYSPQVQPMFRTPGHGTYPMGHMCEAAVWAEILIALTEPSVPPAPPSEWERLREQLLALAERIGDNRIVAGFHFEVDRIAGDVLGGQLGRYFIDFCQLTQPAAVSYHEVTFDPLAGPAIAGNAAPASLPGCAELLMLWTLARLEWAWMNK
jgi:hypothetical protein